MASRVPAPGARAHEAVRTASLHVLGAGAAGAVVEGAA
jgi:hypothetical protein